ncbi:hypothetical protein B0H17DRAFT_1127144 [Mycena rosella]|uniref:Uncharacterized protein n=1 Tax=Mycena rosella TaxID=1033263 RepID=A0AAD7DZP5_MYCRO|nr:hypothetical protein B0H17DRAFT_1127144 [Mycena rosella]
MLICHQEGMEIDEPVFSVQEPGMTEEDPWARLVQVREPRRDSGARSSVEVEVDAQHRLEQTVIAGVQELGEATQERNKNVVHCQGEMRGKIVRFHPAIRYFNNFKGRIEGNGSRNYRIQLAKKRLQFSELSSDEEDIPETRRHMAMMRVEDVNQDAKMLE